MRFKSALAAFLVPFALVLSACAPQVTAGTVSDKEFTEAYQTEEEIMEQECEWDTDTRTTTVNGKSKTTKTKEYECEDVATGEFETIDHAAVYEVTLENDKGDTDTHEVTEAQYNSVEVGDFLDTEAAQ